ncbi:MAG: response regulator [Bacteroidales bacterium]|nr:response regulator [Bacteroidales bacterium]
MKTLKLLVVDDEPGIRSGINRILQNFTVSYPFLEEDLCFAVLEAPSGEDAIEILDKKLPDIVLLDNKLPGIQGVEVLEYINQKGFDCKVAMITSYPSLEIAVKAADDGASDFIPKPFTPAELKASISTITKQLFLKRITAKMKHEGKQVRFQFLSVLSHELKSPLNAITGYLEIMKQKQLGNNIDDYNDMINRSIIRANGMKNLIMDLLDLTKIRLERNDKEVKDVNLKEIAEFAYDTCRPLAIQKDIKFTLECEGDITMKAKPDDIDIIFNNLLSNAVKYNRDGGEVTCMIKRIENNIHIIVEDTGIGLTKDEISKLFQDFVRIKNEKTKYITGSGLGLSILKKVVTLYNGQIAVESKENVGSKFTIVFPV